MQSTQKYGVWVEVRDFQRLAAVTLQRLHYSGYIVAVTFRRLHYSGHITAAYPLESIPVKSLMNRYGNQDDVKGSTLYVWVHECAWVMAACIWDKVCGYISIHNSVLTSKFTSFISCLLGSSKYIIQNLQST